MPLVQEGTHLSGAKRHLWSRGGVMTKAELFTEYGSYHKDAKNRLCHAIGIPLIVLGLFGLLAQLRVGPVDLAALAAIATLVYYAAIDLRGALLSTVIFALLYWAGVHLPWQVALGAFVFGWVFQLIGHRFEGSKPKFLENLVYLLIGPLFIFEEGLDLALRGGRAA